MRALVVTNMWPTADAPHRGIFVADQVDALRRRDDVEVDVFAFPPGPRALAEGDGDDPPREPPARTTTSSTPTSASPRCRRSPPTAGPWS